MTLTFDASGELYVVKVMKVDADVLATVYHVGQGDLEEVNSEIIGKRVTIQPVLMASNPINGSIGSDTAEIMALGMLGNTSSWYCAPVNLLPDSN